MKPSYTNYLAQQMLRSDCQQHTRTWIANAVTLALDLHILCIHPNSHTSQHRMIQNLFFHEESTFSQEAAKSTFSNCFLSVSTYASVLGLPGMGLAGFRCPVAPKWDESSMQVHPGKRRRKFTIPATQLSHHTSVRLLQWAWWVLTP